MCVPISRLGDKTVTGDPITLPGDSSVLIENQPASVMTDTVSGTTCSGTVVSGNSMVLIGNCCVTQVLSDVSGVHPTSGATVSTKVAEGARFVLVGGPLTPPIEIGAGDTEEPNQPGEWSGPRPDRDPEQEGEYIGVPSVMDWGRHFYGVHNTNRGTLCWGDYDNETCVCHGTETENTMALRLHHRDGYNAAYNELVRGERGAVNRQRYRKGGVEGAHIHDVAYRTGVNDAIKDARVRRNQIDRGE